MAERGMRRIAQRHWSAALATGFSAVGALLGAA